MRRRSLAFVLAVVVGCLGLGAAAFAAAGGFESGPSAGQAAEAAKGATPVDKSVVVESVMEGRADPAPFAGPGGQTLYVSKEDFRLVVEAAVGGAAPVMVPARDPDGNIGGYLAAEVGIIPRDVAEAPGFDLAAAVAEHRAMAESRAAERQGPGR